MKANPNPHHLQQITTSSHEFQTHHRYHSKKHLKTPSRICLNYLFLYLQKTVTALTTMRKIVMQKSPPLQDGRCHHKQLLWLCHQQDQSQHPPQQITLPRVIQTKWQHKEIMSTTKTIQPCQFNTLIIISFQMEAIGASMTYRTKHFILENGHNAHLVELPDLKSLLRTSRYFMDEVTGQLYVVFGNSYQYMCTIPRLTHK